MGYVGAFVVVQSIFPEAIVVASPAQIKQDGVYLLFDGAKTINQVCDRASFTLAVCANSYTKENGVMGVVDDLRVRALEAFGEYELRWSGVKAISFENSTLFIVACDFTMEVDF